VVDIGVATALHHARWLKRQRWTLGAMPYWSRQQNTSADRIGLSQCTGAS
jgi:hypothetical protein